MLAQESSSRERDLQAAEWDRWERKHGVAHPDRVRDRIARQAAEQVQRKPQFSTPSVAERGRATRGRAPIPTQNDDPPWELSDDDQELPAMVDMPSGWRSGRNPFYR